MFNHIKKFRKESAIIFAVGLFAGLVLYLQGKLPGFVTDNAKKIAGV